MKNVIIVTAFLAILAPSAAFASFDKNLRYGSRGEAVVELQEFLADQDLYHGPITGRFYALTLSALKTFQITQGIKPISGYFGPLTREKANAILDENILESDLEAGLEPIADTTPAQPVTIIQPLIATTSPQNATTTTNGTPVVSYGGGSSQTPINANMPETTLTNLSDIEIFSPIAGRGLNREYVANPDLAKDQTVLYDPPLKIVDSNMIDLGVYVYDETGKITNTAMVIVEATDASQNKIIDGTGDLRASNYYYAFHYDFKTPGTHVIKFSTKGVTKEVVLNVK